VAYQIAETEGCVRAGKGCFGRWTVQAKLRVGDAVPPGVVSMPGKWWSRPEGERAVGSLLRSSASSPGGQPAFDDIFVE